ncbi:MAG TPA: tRNA lysidine(34) synthetase TilS [Rhodocyclaceae bacterium]|nr:tRNA lysidine(34) synthetase TilS [Rhodocyclaceae bacterium]
MAGSKSSPSSRLLSQLQDYLAARGAPAERLCVGLSGGRDSVVLLHLLVRLDLGSRLSAIHVHHGLSPNAEGWTAFCADLCATLGVPLQVERVAVDDSSGLGREAAARNARYEAFARCGADSLLLAHHQNDQAETLLFNLVRGAGITGAAGMPAERRLGALRLLRPLLGVPRSDIEAYAREHGLAWIDDESNDDTGFSRNFLRHDVLPVIEGRFPAAAACLAGAAAHFSEADLLLADLAETDWRASSEGDCLPMAALQRLSPARLKNLLRYRLRRLGWRVPAARRLEEFVRQLLEAAPDTRPALTLPDGEMRVLRRRLCWIGQGSSL